MPKALTVTGLVVSLVGVFLLFLFGMPFRVATGGKVLTFVTDKVNQGIVRTDFWYSVLGWTGLGCIVVGTVLQICGTVRQP